MASAGTALNLPAVSTTGTARPAAPAAGSPASDAAAAANLAFATALAQAVAPTPTPTVSGAGNTSATPSADPEAGDTPRSPAAASADTPAIAGLPAGLLGMLAALTTPSTPTVASDGPREAVAEDGAEPASLATVTTLAAPLSRIAAASPSTENHATPAAPGGRPVAMGPSLAACATPTPPATIAPASATPTPPAPTAPASATLGFASAAAMAMPAHPAKPAATPQSGIVVEGATDAHAGGHHAAVGSDLGTNPVGTAVAGSYAPPPAGRPAAPAWSSAVAASATPTTDETSGQATTGDGGESGSADGATPEAAARDPQVPARDAAHEASASTGGDTPREANTAGPTEAATAATALADASAALAGERIALARAGAPHAHAQGGSGQTGDSSVPDPGAIRGQVLTQLLGQELGSTGHERMVLHLDPAHLGPIEVRLQADGQKLEIVFTAHSAEAEKALGEGTRELAAAVLGGGGGRWHQVEVRHERPDANRDERQQRQGDRAHDESSPDGGGHDHARQDGRRQFDEGFRQQQGAA